MSTKLTLDDIVDHRAYEAQRAQLRDEVIALKARRRVAVGPILSFTFENRATIRWQIQEMVRVERIMSDEGVQAELDVYNPLIPEPGHLAATMFLELTDDMALHEWLPKLVGIETMIELRLGAGDDVEVVPCVVDPDHARQLTRQETTASEHYISFALTPDQVERFAAGKVTLAATHHNYQHATELAPATVAELTADLRG